MNARDEIMGIVVRATRDKGPALILSEIVSVCARIDAGEITDLGGRSHD